MILYKNGLMVLDYNPGTDILSVALPDVQHFGLTELERSLDIVSEHIKNYDIKRLLLDSSKAVVEVVDDQSYKQVVTVFIANLMKTRLEKVARIGSTISSQEERSATVTTQVRQELNSSIEVQSFMSKVAATNWLTARN
jgi:hypothetical protein